MSKPAPPVPQALGDICVGLGLMTSSQVDQVRTALAKHGRGRFGELALELGLLTEEGLAQGLAQQYHATYVSEERVQRLTVEPALLAMFPPRWTREHLVVPTYLDRDGASLTVLVSDPTDLPSLRTAQSLARSQRLRLFVTTSGALRQLIDRLFPTAGEDTGDERTPTGARTLRPGTVVLEPEIERAAALRRLEGLEGGRAEVVSDPDAVTALVEANLVDRVFYRRSLDEVVRPYRQAWQAHRGVVVAPVVAYGPSRHPAVSYERSADFFLQLLEFVLLAGESRNVSARGRVRETARLVRQVAEELGLPTELRDAVSIVALFTDLEEFSMLAGMGRDPLTSGGISYFELPMAVLDQFESPFELTELFTGLERRLSRRQEVSEDLGVEILFTVRAAVVRGTEHNEDAAVLLADDRALHHRSVTHALTRVLKRRALLGQIGSAGKLGSTVLLAVSEPAVLTAAEASLGAAGLVTVSVTDGRKALAVARSRPPTVMVIDRELEGLEGFELLREVKADPKLAHAKVFLLARRTAEVAQATQAGADDVFARPVNLALLVTKIRRAVVARPTKMTPVVGKLADLPLRDLLVALVGAALTARVELVVTAEPGEVGVTDGQIRSARWGTEVGTVALAALCRLDRGHFTVHFDERVAGRDIHDDAQHLLSELPRPGTPGGEGRDQG